MSAREVFPIEKSPPPLKATKRMSTVSEKRAARDRRYGIERLDFLSEHRICEAQLPDICEVGAVEVHHKGGRARSVFFRRSWWLACCRACHRWITEHPEEAIDRGLSLRRNRVES
jgi:hypothetical protein